jgi:hypothetical protein
VAQGLQRYLCGRPARETEKVMLSKRIIATLIAGSFAAAQAGAHAYLSEAADAAGSISGQQYQAQASETTLSEGSFPEQVTVFSPDGSSYSLVADAYSVLPQPELLVMTSESMPEHLTVFDPDGGVTAYDFTPVDVAYLEPVELIALEMDETPAPMLYAEDGTSHVILVEVADPIIVALADDTSAMYGNVWFDADGAPWSIPDHMAAFDEALVRTG